jgi:polysaccharide biosynthesis/export protein
MKYQLQFAACIGALLWAATASPARAQSASAPPTTRPPQQPAPLQSQPEGVPIPTGYVIGVDDTLAIRFWKDPELSGDVVVRSDGKISLALINDIQARGYTPQELATVLTKAATKYVADPNVTVIVKEIRSRKVFVIGQGVSKSGMLPLNGEMNVLQALAMSGGLLEYADKSNIVIIRSEKDNQEKRFKFDYNEVVRGKNTKQNIVLQPGDTIVVN